MKNIILMTAMVTLSTAAFAQTKAEEQACKNYVQATLTAFEVAVPQGGQPKSLNGLTAADIKIIEETQGSCAAKEEIRRRTMQ